MENGAWETKALEKETAASRRRTEPQVNADVRDQTTAQSRAAHRENPSAVLERRRFMTAAEMQVPIEVHLADAKVHLGL
jgi:hypothetical protein